MGFCHSLFFLLRVFGENRAFLDEAVRGAVGRRWEERSGVLVRGDGDGGKG